jgi:hypothetical protein
MRFFAIASTSAEESQSKLGARSCRLYPGGSAVVRGLQHSCFTDGGGALQSGRDYGRNHDQTLICLKFRILAVVVLIAKKPDL